MMKKHFTGNNKVKRVAAASLAAILAASMAMPVMAAGTYDSIIDETKTGTITLHKIIANNGQNKQHDGHIDPDLNAIVGARPLSNSNGTLDNIPLDKIGFSALKIGSWSSVANDFQSDNGRDDDPMDLDGSQGDSTTGRYWASLDEGIFGPKGSAGTNSILGKLGLEQKYTTFESIVDNGSAADLSDGVRDGKKTQIVYSTADVEEMFRDINASAGTAASGNKPGEVMLNEYVKANATPTNKDKKTNASGAVTFGSMPLGLYVFAETDITAHDGLDPNTGMVYMDQMLPWDVLTEDQRADFVANLTAAEQSDYNSFVGAAPTTSSTQAYKDTYEQKRKEYYENYRKDMIINNGEDGSGADGIDRDNSFYRNPEWPVVETSAKPFLVSLPMTNVSAVTEGSGSSATTYAPGTVWEYSLDIYPKNQTNNVISRILDPDDVDAGNLNTAKFQVTEDFMMNEIVHQVIIADVPKLQPTTYDINDSGISDLTLPVPTHKTFKVKGTMDIGYHFKSVEKVVLVKKTDESPASNEYFTSKTGTDVVELRAGSNNDFVVSGVDGDHTFEITLTENGLAKLDNVAADSQLAVYFASDFDKAACIGTDARTDANVIELANNITKYTKKGNGSYPTLSWKNSNTDLRSIDGNKVYAFTYELDLTKIGLTHPEDSKFEVAHKAGFNSNDPRLTDTNLYNDRLGLVKWVAEDAGIYHVYDQNGMDKDIPANDTRVVVDVSPAHDGKLILKGFDSKTYEFKEVQTQSGASLLKSTFDIEFIENVGLRDGELTDAVLYVDGVTDSLDIDKAAAGNGGIVSVSVDNPKEISLRTGGEGRTMIIVISCIGVAMLAVGAVIYKKKKLA